jgi:hypothetical protein
MVDDLLENANLLESEKDRIYRELETIVLERQWVITQARKGAINESDIEIQLGAMDMQVLSLKRELASIEQVVSIHLLADWEASVKEYLADLKAGLESLNATPKTEVERREIFGLKKQIVNTLVRRVTIDHKRDLNVEIRINLLKLLTDETPERFEEQTQDQIKTVGIFPGWRDDS